MAREQRRPHAESGDERAICAAVPYGRTSQRHETVDQGYNTTRPHLALNRHTPWQRLNNLLGNQASLVFATPIRRYLEPRAALRRVLQSNHGKGSEQAG
jgi:hypothetical protein